MEIDRLEKKVIINTADIYFGDCTMKLPMLNSINFHIYFIFQVNIIEKWIVRTCVLDLFIEGKDSLNLAKNENDQESQITQQ